MPKAPTPAGGRPSSIVVSPHQWAVKWSHAEVLRFAPDNDAAGVTDHPTLTIAVNPGKAEDYNRHTLLHEILHACARSADLRLSDDQEEQFVAALTSPLLSFLRDNPDALTYIIGE
jgi:hypothetical protein